MSYGSSDSPLEVLLEAKREVGLLARQGRLLTPREAWLLSGHTGDSQTLWTVAQRVALRHEVSPQELCTLLERVFPQYSEGGGHTRTWNDLLHRPCHWNDT